MMISAVTAASPARSYTGLKFEGKRNSEKRDYEDIYNEPSRQIKKLAVPLAATILAMSPMSSSASKGMNVDVNAVNTEMYVDNEQNKPKETLVATVDVPENIKRFGGGFICLYSTDDNLNNAEKALLIKPAKGRIITVDTTDGLLVRRFNFKDGKKVNIYYIKAGQKISTEKNGQTDIKILGQKTQIDENFYKFIVGAFGDGIDVEYKDEKINYNANDIDYVNIYGIAAGM